MLPVRVATDASLLRISRDLTEWESLRGCGSRLVYEDSNRIAMAYLAKNSARTLTSGAISSRDVSKDGLGWVTERHEGVKTMGQKNGFATVCHSVLPEAHRPFISGSCYGTFLLLCHSDQVKNKIDDTWIKWSEPVGHGNDPPFEQHVSSKEQTAATR